jgi:glucan biosynthesis protein C
VIGFVLVLALATYVLRILVPMGTWVPIVDFPTSNYLPQYVSFFALGVVAYRRGWFDSTTAAMGRFGLGLTVGATLVFLPVALIAGEWTGHGTLGSLFYALWDSTFAVGIVPRPADAVPPQAQHSGLATPVPVPQRLHCLRHPRLRSHGCRPRA